MVKYTPQEILIRMPEEAWRAVIQRMNFWFKAGGEPAPVLLDIFGQEPPDERIWKFMVVQINKERRNRRDRLTRSQIRAKENAFRRKRREYMREYRARRTEPTS